MSVEDDNIDITDYLHVNKSNFQQMKNKAIKIGYADGVNDGRESLFQIGFDKGYRDGLKTGFSFEKYRFFFNNLNADKIHNKDLMTEKRVYDEISTIDIKSLHVNENIVSRTYVKEINNFAQKMPLATNLLNVSSTTDF